MNPETVRSRSSRVRFGVALPLLTLLAASGCAMGKGFKKVESTEEGMMAAQRAAQADVQAQASSGAPTLQGTTSTVPSLVPGEGRVQLPVAPNAPTTAPQGDKFDNNDAGHLLARCRDRSARHEWFDAVGDCRRSYELNPSSIEPQVELMRLLVTLQSYADAEESARKVLAARPNDPVALYYLAWSYRGREKFPESIAALQRAIAADPKRVEYVQALGITYGLALNFGQSIATLERALSMRPGDTKTQHALYSAQSILAERMAPYLKLVKEKPGSYDNHAALGFMYQKYGMLQQALTAYDSALAKIPTPLPEQDAETKKIAAQIYYNRGVVYRELGRPALGEPALWQAMQLDPSLAAFSWYYTGLCRYDEGKFDTSIDALRKSIELAPDVAENRTALADSYEKAGKPDLAAEQRNAVAAIEARTAAEKAAFKEEDTAHARAADAKAAAEAAAAEAAAAPTPAPAAPSSPATEPAAAPAPLAAPAAPPASAPVAAPAAAAPDEVPTKP